MKRLTAYLTGLSQIEVREDEIREPNEGEILVQIKAIGICGSDITYYQKGTGGSGYVKYPHIPGHECAGVVYQVGKGIEEWKPGDRIAIEPGVPCGKCTYCLGGRYNLCKRLSFMSTAVVREYGEGGMASFVIRPDKMLYSLPDSMSFEQGAMLEPISVALHAFHQSGLRSGQSAAILGCGPIAGCIMQVLKASGIDDIYMTDVIESRTKVMKRLGAKDAYDTSRYQQEETENLLPQEVDCVFDTTCSDKAINTSVKWLKKGGTIVLVGVPHGYYNLDMNAVFNKEARIHTSFRYVNTYDDAIAMISSGRLKPEELITHRFPLRDAVRAMELASSRDPSVLKIILNP